MQRLCECGFDSGKDRLPGRAGVLECRKALVVPAEQGLLRARAQVGDMNADRFCLADAVEAARGIRPGLPERMADLFDRPERVERLPNDLAALKAFVANQRA